MSELSSFYKRYMGDSLTIMPDLNEAIIFLDKLNSCHRNLKFTMEIAEQNTIPLVGMNINIGLKHQSTRSPQILGYFCTTTATWTSIIMIAYTPLCFIMHISCHLLLLHFSAECNKPHSTFPNLDYQINSMDSVINKF